MEIFTLFTIVSDKTDPDGLPLVSDRCGIRFFKHFKLRVDVKVSLVCVVEK